MNKIRLAKNGCSSDVTFTNKKVYFDWDHGLPKSFLGDKLNKTEFLKKLVDEKFLESVEKLMIDWELYENGWYVGYKEGGYKNKHLFYYLQQMNGYGSFRPEILDCFDN
jgi:hypothetical protein